VHARLAGAIRDRRVVTFAYDGLPRTVRPAVLGVLAGHETLHGYQTGGGSRHGGLPQWRNFTVDRIAGLAVLEETFEDDPPGYGHVDFDPVYAALG
jgi:predicted DNA-binding transcriptional regulator YafY